MFEFSSMDQGTLILTVSTCVLGTLLVIVLIWLCLKSYNVRCFPGRKEPQQDLRTFDGIIEGSRKEVEPNAFVRKSGFLEKVDRRFEGGSGDVVQEERSEKRWYDLYGKRLFFRSAQEQWHIADTSFPIFSKSLAEDYFKLLMIGPCRYFKSGILLRGEIDLLKTRVYVAEDEREFILELGEERTILRAASALERTGWLQAHAHPCSSRRLMSILPHNFPPSRI